MAIEDNIKIIKALFFLAVVFIISLIIPITNIAFGGMYYEQIECSSYTCKSLNLTTVHTFNVGLPTDIKLDLWMIANGVIMIMQLLSTFGLYNKLHSEFKRTVLFFALMYIIFFLTAFMMWIVGAITLWSYCVIIEQRDFNSVMHVTLLAQLLWLMASCQYFLVSIKQISGKKNEND